MTDPSSSPIDRHAARVLLLDRADRLLLFRCQEPGSARAFWITPGGGLEPGESHQEAARRELREETGLVVGAEALGPCVWQRVHTFPWLDKVYRQHEWFYLVRCDRHTVDPAEHTREELMVLTESRWWSADTIREAKGEHFAPRGIGGWLTKLLHEGTPEIPWDVGV